MSALGLLVGRYLISRRDRFVSVIAAIAVLGVAVGVAALITVIAVMTGFDQDLEGKIIGANAHLVIQGDGSVSDPDAVVQKITAVPGVLAAAPFVQGQALLSARGATTGVLLRGIDPAREPRVTELARLLSPGTSLDPGPNGIILGRVLAERLALMPGDVVQVMTPVRRTPESLRVAGTFSSGMYDYDANLALTRLTTAQTLLGLDAAVTGIGVRVQHPRRVDRVQAAVRHVLRYPYWSLTWREQNRNLFAALQLEKLVMFLILTLIVLVACFNIVATLLMMVIERTRDIGILRALGMAPRDVRAVFTCVGMAIGGAGTLLGLAGGVGLCEFLQRSQWVKLPPDVYYLDHLPAHVVWSDVGLIMAAACAISWLACLYPASVAARLHPVDALRQA